MPAILGIDLGTTFSVVATLDEIGRPSIVHNPDGVNITPSCVTESDGVIEVGEFARRMWDNAPARAAARFKRYMGTAKTYSINGQEFTPTELSAFVLKKLVKDARSTLGEIGDAVVTIPANFAHEARDATMSAAKAAGLNVKFILITYRVPWKGTVPQRVRIPPGKLSLQPVAIGADDGGNDIVRSTSV